MSVGLHDPVDVVVVGGGAAGIGAALGVLRHPGLSVLLIEAGACLGGRARTMAMPGTGAPMDLGCGWLHGALSNIWTGIAETTPGFTVDRQPAPWDDDARGLGLSPEEDERFGRAMADLHARVVSASGVRKLGPLSDLLPAGSPWRGRLDAVSTYVSGAELDRVSVEDSAHYRPGDGDDWRVVEGYGTLVAHHGRAVPAMLGTAVPGIDHSGADAIRVDTDRGALSARAVVLAVSTAVLAAETIRFYPALPDKAEAAAALPLGLADKLYLRLPEPDLFPVEGYCIGAADAGRTAAYHTRPFGRPLIECFYGGDLARDLERDGMAAALDFARGELRGQFGGAAARSVEPIHMTAWGREPHIGGSYAYARPGSAGMRSRLAEPVDRRLFFAGEACSPERFTTAHGAYETGVAAAATAVAALT